MAEPSCGASVQAVAARVAVLEQDGVPLPGAGNLYVTDALIKLEATPSYTKGADIEQLNAAGSLCVAYRQRDVLKRFELSLEICTLDPELEHMLAGGESFTSGGLTIGGASPGVATIGAPFGVSLELWSRHIVNGDLDGVWPYIHWAIPRSYWQPGKTTWDNNNMTRPFDGYTSENPNWYNGPGNDWAFDSTKSIGWIFTKTVPTPTCGAQTLVSS